jgi:hypothetical protein
VKQREEGSGASWEGAAREKADHAGETPEHALHAGRERGKRECPTVGPRDNMVVQRCGAVRGGAWSE